MSGKEVLARYEAAVEELIEGRYEIRPGETPQRWNDALNAVRVAALALDGIEARLADSFDRGYEEGIAYNRGGREHAEAERDRYKADAERLAGALRHVLAVFPADTIIRAEEYEFARVALASHEEER